MPPVAYVRTYVRKRTRRACQLAHGVVVQNRACRFAAIFALLQTVPEDVHALRNGAFAARNLRQALHMVHRGTSYEHRRENLLEWGAGIV